MPLDDAFPKIKEQGYDGIAYKGNLFKMVARGLQSFQTEYKWL
jgi:hypothetical protein